MATAEIERPLWVVASSANPNELIDGRPRLREWIAENTQEIETQAHVASHFAMAGDDKGLTYAVSTIRARMKQVIEALNDLNRANAEAQKIRGLQK